jgi:hypothetical protein
LRFKLEAELISDILIDQKSSDAFLTVQNADGTKASAPLKSSDFEVDIGEEAINKIRLILDRWGEKRKAIAEFYLTEKREIDSFVYDLIALAHFASRLHVDHDNLLGRRIRPSCCTIESWHNFYMSYLA